MLSPITAASGRVNMQSTRVARSVITASICVASLGGLFVASSILGASGGFSAATASERSASTMASAATAFLGSLAPEQRQQAVFALDSEELTRWHYVPAQQFPR